MMREFNAKDANFLWRQIGRIDGVIETLNRTEGEMPEIIAGVLKRIRDDITIVGQKYCNKEQKTICLCNVSFFIFIEKSAGL